MTKFYKVTESFEEAYTGVVLAEQTFYFKDKESADKKVCELDYNCENTYEQNVIMYNKRYCSVTECSFED